uniref:Chromosome X open reading frame 21 n=2 Tax=Nothobranchius rachovii TaxID=451742 RepID=A0A1A8PHM8_9TELE
MLCEGTLLSMTYGEVEEVDIRPTQVIHSSHESSLITNSHGPSPLVHHCFSMQTDHTDDTSDSADLYISPLQSFNVQGNYVGRQISPEIEIPDQAHSGGDIPFLVPSFCQSICENYSDLHIGAVEDSLSGQASQGGPLSLLRRGTSHWRQGSGRDRSFLFQGREGPFSNSLLNHYLEQKILDLYQQYMMENMVREKAPGSNADAGIICPLLGSELVLTSVDQITLQLSREGNLEAGLAKDMVLSCLLRVASDLQSGEISTPFLQISNEASREQLTDSKPE